MLIRTADSMSATLKRLPPYFGMSESTSSTRAPMVTSRRARLEPMKPSPPVMRTNLARPLAMRKAKLNLPGAVTSTV